MELKQRLRSGEQVLGYWVVMDAPVATERVARVGYDYVCMDAQHGLMDHMGIIRALTAVDAGGVWAGRAGRPAPAGMVRVRENSPGAISQALDAGAAGVIVPMVDTAEEAARAVAAVRYPPQGERSYGPMRAILRVGTDVAAINDGLLCLVMIETAEGLANVDEIARTPGIDGLYIGPSDLTLALGGRSSSDTGVLAEFDDALARVRTAAEAAGIWTGIHTLDGETARKRLGQGFDLVTVACDLNHLDAAASAHLAAARAASGPAT